MIQKYILILILIIFYIGGYSQETKKYECFRVLKTKKEAKDFLFKRYGFNKSDFQPGDIIADVGAGNGYVSGMISMFYSNLIFYIQDIDSNCCNLPEVKKVFEHYGRLKGKINTNYTIVLGTLTSSCLPSNKFDKIIMCSVFHFIENPLSYFKDLHDKLKLNGKLILINFYADDKNNRNSLTQGNTTYKEPTLNEIVEPIQKSGFKLVYLKRNKYSAYNKLIFIKK